MDCEFVVACPIFARFKSENMKNFWIRIYCRGTKTEQCERKKRRLAGLPVPITMLPNGTHLETLADD